MSDPRLAIIPARAVTDPSLEGRDLQVLCLLGRHTDDNGWCRRSQVKMAREIGCARSTVQLALGRLVAAGYLEQRAEQRESGADAALFYRVVLDPPVGAGGADRSAGVPTGRQGGADDGVISPPANSVGTQQNRHSDAENTRRHPLPTGAGGQKPAETLGADNLGNRQNRKSSAPMLTTPLNDSERDARASAGEGQEPQSSPEPAEPRMPHGELLGELKLKFPGASHADQVAVDELWRALSPDERRAAVARLADWLAEKAPGRKATPGLERYLGQKLWTVTVAKVEAARAASGQVFAEAFGRAWWALWLGSLMRAPREAGQADSALHRLLAGKASLAARGIGWSLPADALERAEEAGRRMLQVRRDGPEVAAWDAWCRTLGPVDAPLHRRGIRLPLPDVAPFVWLPAAEPPDIDTGALALGQGSEEVVL